METNTISGSVETNKLERKRWRLQPDDVDNRCKLKGWVRRRAGLHRTTVDHSNGPFVAHCPAGATRFEAGPERLHSSLDIGGGAIGLVEAGVRAR